jgi:cytochrome c biogenesis protein CcmG, thiol:disulfide interchange protein DsbE
MSRANPFSLARQLIILVAAAVCLGLAALLVLAAGLPDRAAYTGWMAAGGDLIAPEIGARAPSFALPAADGERVELAASPGGPVLVNFWATWCVPCAVEMPELQTLYQQHQSDGLRILAVNMGEPPAAVRAWGRELGLTYDLLIDQDEAVARLYRLRAQPSTFVISPRGIITHIYHGPASEEQLRAALSPYLLQSNE